MLKCILKVPTCGVRRDSDWDEDLFYREATDELTNKCHPDEERSGCWELELGF